MTDDELKSAEEARRERNWDPQLQWKVLQETIAWAEAQLTVQRNTKQSRLREQQEKLARLIAYESTGKVKRQD